MSYSRERSTAAWQKPAWIKHSFYSISENSSGCTGSLRLIGEGLWWSHQSERNDSVTPAEKSNVSSFWVTLQETGCLARLTCSGVSIRERRWTEKLIPQRKWVSHMQRFVKQLLRTEQSPDKLFSCLVFPSDISLNPKARAWMCWAVCCRGPNLCVHWPGGLELPFGVKKEAFF